MSSCGETHPWPFSMFPYGFSSLHSFGKERTRCILPHPLGRVAARPCLCHICLLALHHPCGHSLSSPQSLVPQHSCAADGNPCLGRPIPLFQAVPPGFVALECPARPCRHGDQAPTPLSGGSASASSAPLLMRNYFQRRPFYWYYLFLLSILDPPPPHGDSLFVDDEKQAETHSPMEFPRRVFQGFQKPVFSLSAG